MTGAGASFGLERARHALAGSRFGDVRWTASTGSTNTDLLALARRGAAEGAVLVADHQTAGRGRRGRSWEAPAGASLLVSILFRPSLAPERRGRVPMALGVAAADAVDEVAGVQARLKWPNDLVVSVDLEVAPRKLGGMLAEGDGGTGALVVGLGLNVNWRGTAPPSGAERAVALDALTGGPVDRTELLIALLRHLDTRYACLVADEGVADSGRAGEHEAELVAAYRERSATIGRRVRVVLADGELEGTARSVTDVGALVVDVAGAGPTEVVVGDVVHLHEVPLGE